MKVKEREERGLLGALVRLSSMLFGSAKHVRRGDGGGGEGGGNRKMLGCEKDPRDHYY